MKRNITETKKEILMELGDKRTYNCVLCGLKKEGRGHDPAPLKYFGECCNICNVTKVLQARLKNMGGRWDEPRK